jgi:hypothetical protein
MVFNNFYNRLRNLSTSTKPKASRNNIEFGTAQIMDILLLNWFLVDPMFIVPNFEEEDEGVVRIELETQIVRGNRLLEAHF